MSKFDRKLMLDDMKYNHNWIVVRDWIHDMVSMEPKVMKQVSQARFGDLGNWIENDAFEAGVAAMFLGEACGQEDAVKLIKSEIVEQLRLRARRIFGGKKRSRSAKRKSDGTFKA